MWVIQCRYVIFCYFISVEDRWKSCQPGPSHTFHCFTLELKMFLLNPSIYHDLFDFWGNSSRFFFSTLPSAKKMVQLHAKPGEQKKTHDIPGANFWSFNFTTLNLFVSFFLKFPTSANSKSFSPGFLFFHKQSTAENWPRVGPKQMAAWEKYFNSFKPRFPRLWWHKLFP